MLTSPPKDIRENIARAKGYLHRGELPRALLAMAAALRGCVGVKMFKQARFELAIHFDEFLSDLVRHPGMQPLLDPENTGRPRKIPYQPSKEGALAAVLEGIAKILQEAETAKKRAAEESKQNRKQELMETGTERILQGDTSRGRAYLKRAAAEFGHEPGVYRAVALRFQETKQYADAAEMFEQAMEHEPKEPDSYTQGINCYLQLHEYEKAEAVYMKILRQFGGHPTTFGRMAKLYMLSHQRVKAEDFAVRTLQLDPNQPDALQVMEILNKFRSGAAH